MLTGAAGVEAVDDSGCFAELAEVRGDFGTAATYANHIPPDHQEH